MNWGRGISWYILGLSQIETDDLTLESQNTVYLFNKTLTALWQKDHKFGHFVHGLCYGYECDLTADLPIIWYLNKNNYINLTKEEIIAYSKYMHNGIMYHNSNSNEGAIKYGVAHGPNPLAQAFMLRLTK